MSEQLEHNQRIGHLLAEAREKLGLTREEVATRLKLKEKVIVALENGNFNALQLSTYVRGYIRSYANLVKLNAEALIKEYENLVEPPPEIVPTVKPPGQSYDKDKLVKLITYLLTFTLLVLFIIWWRGQHDASDSILVIPEVGKTDISEDFSYT